MKNIFPVPVLAELITEVQKGARGSTKGCANECSTVTGEAREGTKPKKVLANNKTPLARGTLAAGKTYHDT